MRKCANISPIYEEAVSHISFATAPFWISLYCIWGKFDFLFFRCEFSGPSYSCSFPGERNLCLCCWEYMSCTPHHTSATIYGGLHCEKSLFDLASRRPKIALPRIDNPVFDTGTFFLTSTKFFTFPQVRNVFRSLEGDFLLPSCRKSYG